MEKTTRTNISVPFDVARGVRENKQINWSKVATDAFRSKLKGIDPDKPKPLSVGFRA